MKLNFQAMQILTSELTSNEMWAIYLMGQGEDLPESVAKTDLTKIIVVLCTRLKWIREDHELNMPWKAADIAKEKENTSRNQQSSINSSVNIEQIEISKETFNNGDSICLESPQIDDYSCPTKAQHSAMVDASMDLEKLQGGISTRNQSPQ